MQELSRNLTVAVGKYCRARILLHPRASSELFSAARYTCHALANGLLSAELTIPVRIIRGGHEKGRVRQQPGPDEAPAKPSFAGSCQ